MDMGSYPILHFKISASRKPNQAYPKVLKTLGDHIRKIRLDRKMSQGDVAKILKITTDTVANWELNRTKPYKRYWTVIEKFLGEMPQGFELTKYSRPLILYRYQNNIPLKALAQEMRIDQRTLEGIERGTITFKERTLNIINRFIREMKFPARN